LTERDQNLANREMEHSRKVEDINTKHDAAIRTMRADHDKAMASRLEENRQAQAKFDADLHEQQRAMVAANIEWHDEHARVYKAHCEQVAALNKSYEELRTAKDVEIARLHATIET